MTNINYEQFIVLINKYKSFDKNTLNAMYEEFGKEKVDSFFDKYYGSLNEQELSKFLKKYAIYFEENQVKEETDNDYCNYSDIVSMMIYDANKYPIMDNKMEYEQGLILNEGRENLEIIDKNDDGLLSNLYPKVDVEKILLSIKSTNDIELLKKIKKLPFVLKDENIFRNDLKYISRYLKNCNDEVIEQKKLKELFPELSFDNIDIISDFTEQADLLIRYVTAKFNFYHRNLKLVISFSKRIPSKNITFEEKIQEGNVGLIRAINRFDVLRGYKFSTYAIWWIRQAVSRMVLDQDDSIRKPVYFGERLKKYNYFIHDYVSKNGCEPSVEEIASGLEISLDEVYELSANGSNVVSLDAPITNGDGEADDFFSFIKNDEVLIEDRVVSSDLLDFVIKIIKGTFDERSQDILFKRWGLNSENKHYTLEEIGEYYGLTRERVRQIESVARRKIKMKVHRSDLL